MIRCAAFLLHFFFDVFVSLPFDRVYNLIVLQHCRDAVSSGLSI